MDFKLDLRGPGSSVGIATGYGLDGPVSNPGGGEIFRVCPDRPWVPPNLLYNGYRVFPGGRGGRGVGLTHHLHVVPKILEMLYIPPRTIRACVAYKKSENLPKACSACT